VTVVLLDSGPLGLLTHPQGNSEATECKAWLKTLLTQGHTVFVPEITYYETRRELRRSELRHGVPSTGLANLEAFVQSAGLIALTSETLVLASEFWALARHHHFQGSPDAALDADMILCAQASLLSDAEQADGRAAVLIATTTVKHLTHFADARLWRDIPLSG
jgi:predicted nucleic acid-binding protein